ncbi:hypothetical protein [Gordonia malaquae]|nr:hypothetical protein [Gordonia malaquae]
MAERADQLDYWTKVREQQISEGAATNYGPDTIAKDDKIKTRGTWYLVVRVNKKTVSVDVSDMYQAPTRC